MPAKLWREWELYDQIEPIGAIRSDYQSAQVVQTLYNVHRTKKDKPIKIQDVLLKFGPPEEKPKKSPEQLLNVLKVLSAMHANEGEQLPSTDNLPSNLSPAERLRALAGDNPNVTFAS